jgi:hypothetical protein
MYIYIYINKYVYAYYYYFIHTQTRILGTVRSSGVLFCVFAFLDGSILSVKQGLPVFIELDLRDHHL